jgi:transcription elongation factor Elf1
MIILKKPNDRLNNLTHDNKAKNTSTCIRCGKQIQLFSTILTEIHNKVWGLCKSCHTYTKYFLSDKTH